MKEISEHCSVLSKLISGYDVNINWPNQFDWLNIASGVVKVEFDLIRHDDCFGYCGSADDWHGAREELLEKYLTEFTRFTYVWGAVESLIEDINPTPAPLKGGINSICNYLKNNLSSKDIIAPYDDLVTNLEQILQNTDVNEPKILNRFSGAEHVSFHGIGLYVIYKLRNLFAHGAIGFPLPNEDNNPKSNYPDMVHISTRIVLLTLQMIWLSFYRNSKLRSRIYWELYETDENDEDYEYYINEILHNIHLENPKYTQEVKC